MSSKLFWAPPNFEWHTLLSTYLSNQLFWALFLAFYSFEQFFEPSFERWNSFEHFFEHSQECTYSQEHFFEWIYSHECSFGHFLKGSRSTRTYLVWVTLYWYTAVKQPKSFAKIAKDRTWACMWIGLTEFKLVRYETQFPHVTSKDHLNPFLDSSAIPHPLP